jgi:replication factor A1
MILTVDKNKTIHHIVDSSKMTNEFHAGDVIECMPSKIFGKSITIDGDSFVRKIDDDSTIKSQADMRTKIADIAPGEDLCVDAIILKVPGRREIQTKAGDNVALSEILVEDDSGQIWVKAWRNNARLLDRCELGQIISITGVTAKKGFEDKMELTLTAFSSITKKN